MTPGPLVLRADGGDGVGAGHVGRCLALAEAWQRAGGDALLAVTEPAARQARRMGPAVDLAILDVEPGSVHDRRTTTQLSEDGWLVLDGYRFAPWSRSSDGPVLVIDDFGHGGCTDATIILDQNLGADAGCYPHRPAAGQLLLGPRYALLRDPSPAPTAVAGRSATPRTVLVSVGGEPLDPVLAHVAAVVTALVGTGVQVEVIGGVTGDDLPRRPGLVVHGFVDDPSALMARADLAVAAAGSTVYALCRFGVPAVVVPFHPNQEPIAHAFEHAGVALTPRDPTDPDETIALVRSLLTDDGRRRQLGSAARALVDGWGAARVVAEMQRS